MKTILVDAVNTFVVDKVIDQKIYYILEKFENRKIILTNANDLQMIEFGLIDLPYELYSLKHNPEKTDPKFFKQFMLQYNLNSTDCIYFEHNPEAVQSAIQNEILSFHFDKMVRDYEGLENFLEENLK